MRLIQQSDLLARTYCNITSLPEMHLTRVICTTSLTRDKAAVVKL